MGTKWNNEMNFISNIWSIKVPPGEDPDRRKHVWLVKFKKLNLKIIYISRKSDISNYESIEGARAKYMNVHFHGLQIDDNSVRMDSSYTPF